MSSSQAAAAKLDLKLKGRYESLFQQEVSGGLKKIRHEPGNNISCCCPLHDESNPSFSFNTETGMWRCFSGCGEGNFTAFVARMRGITTQDAFKILLKENGLEDEPNNTHNQAQQVSTQNKKVSLTLDEYANMKRMDKGWLQTRFQISEETNAKGVKFIKFPYFDRNGQLSGPVRVRYGKRNGKNDFGWGGTRKINDDYGNEVSLIGLYGEWLIPEYESLGYSILVEGESDTQSLIWMDFPALGIPGAQMFDKKMARSVLDINKLYIHQENDQAGEEFVEKIVQFLRQESYKGEVYVFACSKAANCKDPSELLIAKGKDEATHILHSLIKNADLRQLNAPPPVPELIKGAPIHLRPPFGYTYNTSGIYKIDAQTGEQKIICSSPILLTAKLENISDPDTEKLEIAFLKHTHKGSEWKLGIFPRNVLFGTKCVDELMNFGIPITQKRMATMNEYLLCLENSNQDTIPILPSTSHFGWQEDGDFLPSEGNDIRRDMNIEMVNSISSKGTLEGWLDAIAPIRDKNWRLRIFLTVAFAAPLLQKLNVRNFGIYNWDDTRAGKTAGASIIASVWGNREKLIIPFSSTGPGIMETAALFSDLPLLIDERQTKGKDRYAQDELEGLIYQLCFGRSKQKSTRLGGLASSKTWSTILFMTGEQPLIEMGTQNGVATRIIQVLGGPFPEDEGRTNMDAVRLYDSINENYGTAGIEFIKRLKKVSDKKLLVCYQQFRDEMVQTVDAENRKYESYLAVIALADAIAQHWIFDKSEDDELFSEEDKKSAIRMVKEFLERQKRDVQPNTHLVATQLIVEYIAAYASAILEKLPEPDEDRMVPLIRGFKREKIYYLNHGLLKKHLDDAGFPINQHKPWWAERGIIQYKENDATGRRLYVFNQRPVPGSDSAPYFVFNLKRAIEVLEDEGITTSSDFIDVGSDDELPFD